MDFFHGLFVSLALFLVGLWGLYFNRRNVLVMLMSIELLLLAINLTLLLFGAWCDDVVGSLFALVVLTVAAAESAIGLALVVLYYRSRGTIEVVTMTRLAS
jgi:NADH-quinone oxidoreductase subunit K